MNATRTSTLALWASLALVVAAVTVAVTVMTPTGGPVRRSRPLAASSPSTTAPPTAACVPWDQLGYYPTLSCAELFVASPNPQPATITWARALAEGY